MGSVIIIGGTAGIGRELAAHYAAAGRSVVVTGRDLARAENAAAELSAGQAGNVPQTRGLALDLNHPHDIAPALADVGPVDRLVLAAIERDLNTIANYDIDRAIRLTQLKLVGYHAVVHAVRSQLAQDSSVLLFGGVAKHRPYPGSTTVSTINAGVIGMTRTLSVELAPIRVNSVHPAIIGDSPFWLDKPEQLEYTRNHALTDRLVETADVVDACVFLLENRSINGVDLPVDGGFRER